MRRRSCARFVQPFQDDRYNTKSELTVLAAKDTGY